MSAGVEFPAASVLRHAAAVSDTSEQMAHARSALRQVSLDGGAYGQLCQFLPGLLNALFGSATEAMNEVVEALGETALKLRTTATHLTAADVDSARRLDNTDGPGRVLPL